ncbi:hypothetical protein FIE12Z_10680 [Fusarium flagelliforme]|uniref:Uncharacterized protein n=1 Tax=Fusarium flagelliforme TaxID=2675880 RepID=A0A395MAX1_9HYPO|nr:hypothetical protein FIE12Z_10680 [Fusarium flagelliforme]
MHPLLKSAKRWLRKAFGKKYPKEVADDRKWKAFKAEERESKRALKRHRREARMKREGQYHCYGVPDTYEG